MVPKLILDLFVLTASRGFLVAIPSVIASTLYCMTLKTPVLPKEEYVKAAQDSDDIKLPSLSKSLTPIILPLILIFCNTLASVIVPETLIANFLSFFGSPLAALLSGCIASLILTGKQQQGKYLKLQALVQRELQMS